ncbi:hypothetical protein [Enterobacter roggenkampii]|uniref:hypothetical protein n=1 Tax=Enterobacter roggenkampii TaxID=1812935 RepID=UPI001E3AEC96|nr:hypothetical protein [Enterobacter roggenkampii]
MSIKNLVEMIKHNGLLSSMSQLEKLYQAAIENEQKLAELESRCAALAAENAGLKAALRPSDIPSEWTDAFGDTAVIEHDATGDNQGHSVSWSWVGNQEEVIKSVLLAVEKGIETPSTDAFLAEVRAHDLNAFIRHHSAELDAHIKNGGEQFDEKSVRIRDIIVSARLFREQIRKEAAQ